jgi:hypothetical protein
MDSYSKLLNSFNALPQKRQQRTIMEISGYPHYENVCSNILAFYFDVKAEHSLGDLLLRSLFEVIPGEDAAQRTATSISREYTTNKGGRLDIVIQGEGFVVGIENKIYHWLANDLNDYSTTLKTIAQQDDKIYKLVLGLKPVPPKQLTNNFKSITYADLWAAVSRNLGEYITTADSKWLSHLVDFFQTTTNLAGNNMERKANDQFFIQHHETLERLTNERNDFIGRLKLKANELRELLLSEDKIEGLSKDPWLYRGDTVVLDMTIHSHDLAFDLSIDPTGWQLLLFGRNKGHHSYLKQLAGNNPDLKLKQALRSENGRYIVQSWPLDTEIVEIVNGTKEWVNLLTATSTI